MAHYARVANGVVKTVHVVANAVITDEDGIEQEELGAQFLANLHGYSVGELIQCSYNGTFRGSYPGIGWIYDSIQDVFFEPDFPTVEA
jgi:hypothetical protein